MGSSESDEEEIPQKSTSKSSSKKVTQKKQPQYDSPDGEDDDPSDESDSEFVEKPNLPSPFKIKKQLKSDILDTNSNCSTISSSAFKLDTPEPEKYIVFKHGGATKPPEKQERKKPRKVVFRTLN